MHLYRALSEARAQRRYHTEVELVVGTFDVHVPTRQTCKNDQLRMLGMCLLMHSPPEPNSKWRNYEEFGVDVRDSHLNPL